MGNSNKKNIDLNGDDPKDPCWKEFLVNFITTKKKEELTKKQVGGMDYSAEIGKIIIKRLEKDKENEKFVVLDFCYSLVISCYEYSCSNFHQILKIDTTSKRIFSDEEKTLIQLSFEEINEPPATDQEPEFFKHLSNHDLRFHRLFCNGTVVKEGV